MNRNPALAWMTPLLILLLVSTAGATDLVSSVQANGGGTVVGQSHRLDFTVGQTSTGLLNGQTHHAQVGFWYFINLDPVSDIPAMLAPTRLDQNAPNPFNPSTTIRFSIGMDGHADLKLYDLRGHLVATLVDQEMIAGEHAVVFEPRGLSSGIYFYRLRTMDKVLTRRMTLIK